MFIWPSFSSGSEFWSVTHTSIYEKLKVSDNVGSLGKISNNCPNDLLETNTYNTLEWWWLSLLKILQFTKRGIFSSLVILLLVLPSSFTVSSVKSLR